MSSKPVIENTSITSGLTLISRRRSSGKRWAQTSSSRRPAEVMTYTSLKSSVKSSVSAGTAATASRSWGAVFVSMLPEMARVSLRSDSMFLLISMVFLLSYSRIVFVYGRR